MFAGFTGPPSPYVVDDRELHIRELLRDLRGRVAIRNPTEITKLFPAWASSVRFGT